MNSLEILKALKKNKKLSKFFTGVYPCNHLPKNIRTPAFIVANTDPSHKRGTHWIAIYISKSGATEIFNSFGALQPIQDEFRAFLKKNSKNGYTVTNTKRLQSDFSLTCGNYCCMYLYSKACCKDMKYFLGKFSNHSFKDNDTKIMNMYYKYFPVSTQNDTEQMGGLICNQTCTPRKFK